MANPFGDVTVRGESGLQNQYSEKENA